MAENTYKFGMSRRNFLKGALPVAGISTGVYAGGSLGSYLMDLMAQEGKKLAPPGNLRVVTKIDETIAGLEKRGMTHLYFASGNCGAMKGKRQIMEIRHEPESSYTKLLLVSLKGDLADLPEIDPKSQESMASAFKGDNYHLFRVLKEKGGDLGEHPMDFAEVYDSKSDKYVLYKLFTPEIKQRANELFGCAVDFFESGK
jgi:hypothetical protein